MSSYESFQNCDIRVGTVVDAQSFPEARKPAIKLWIDFGPLGIKKTSAQITKRYRIDTLLGVKVVALLNIPARQVGTFMSECLLLGACPDQFDVALLTVPEDVPNGTPIA